MSCHNKKNLTELAMKDTALKDLNLNSKLNNKTTHGNKTKKQTCYPVLENNSILYERINIGTKLNLKRQRRHSRRNCSGLCERSLCPWREVMDVDTDRIPSAIPKAVCSRKCQFDFTDPGVSKFLNVYTACEPLTLDIPIVKNNNRTHLKDWPIACVCVKKSISTVSRKNVTASRHQRSEDLEKPINMVKHRRQHKGKNQRRSNRQRHRTKLRIMSSFMFFPKFKK
ncbi:uncharacterized protein LOC123529700 isoform X2 [Mercenaria mercenaria]|uniref:uncharacterized protein LOC123529700 isoform X2 n=1 Tax=Mercenaria mercenaria TaxID=6596 RepID=UPI00234ED005|nr:uncharacterized protein LOC123529700 isoform X2 [Mercenaria mercenaria]